MGSNGNYWTSSPNGTNVRNPKFNSTNANFDNANRATARAVRCFRITTPQNCFIYYFTTDLIPY